MRVESGAETHPDDEAKLTGDDLEKVLEAQGLEGKAEQVRKLGEAAQNGGRAVELDDTLRRELIAQAGVDGAESISNYELVALLYNQTREQIANHGASRNEILAWGQLYDSILTQNTPKVTEPKVDKTEKSAGLVNPEKATLKRSYLENVIKKIESIPDDELEGGNTPEERQRLVDLVTLALDKDDRTVTDNNGNMQQEGVPVDGILEFIFRQVYGENYMNEEIEGGRFRIGTLPTASRQEAKEMDDVIAQLEGRVEKAKQNEGSLESILLGYAATLLRKSERYYDFARPTAYANMEDMHKNNGWRIAMEATRLYEEDGSPDGKSPENPEYIDRARDIFTRRREVFIKDGGTRPPRPTPVPVPDPEPDPVPPVPDPDPVPPVPPVDPDPVPPPVPPPHPPTEPRPPEITPDERLRAHKLAENILRAMEEEERNRQIERGLDKAGFLGSLLFRGRTIRKVDQENKFRVTAEMRDIVEEYALQQIIGRNITASGNELYRLMQARGFDINPETGEFDPTHADSTWLNRLLHIDRTKTTGAVFAGGIVLGHAARAAMATVLDGVGRAVGAGAVVGGISGWLRGRREAAEATGSGDAWVADMERALDSGNDGEIELACHKAERLMMDPAAQREFFRGRTRHEAVRILEKYQEGMRRLAMNRMAREAAETISAERNPDATPREISSLAADLYVRFCEDMAGVEETTAFVYEGHKREEEPSEKVDRRRIADEQAFERMHGWRYQEAFARELSIIRGEQATPIDPDDAAAREEVLIGYNRETRLRRNNRRRIVAGHIVRGALIGGIAGGIGYYIGNLIAGATGHEGAGGGASSGGESSPDGGVWGHFTNENTMPEQAFTPDRVHALGLDSLTQDPRCPSSFIDGQLFYGTDQGAALREAALTWKDQLNFHGMDPTRISNLMSFGGSENIGLGGDYSFSLGQVQSVIDHIHSVGEHGIFDTNSIMAVGGLSQAESVVGASVEQGAKGIWPGWLLLAGAVGYKVDSDRRQADINETNRQAATSPIGPPLGEPQMGRYIRTFASERPEPEPEPATPPTGAAGGTPGTPATPGAAGGPTPPGTPPTGGPSGVDRGPGTAEPEPGPEPEPATIPPGAAEEEPPETTGGESGEGPAATLETSRARLSEITSEQHKLRDRFGEELDRNARFHRGQLKVGNKEPLFNAAEMTALLEQEGINPENITSETTEEMLAASVRAKIENAASQQGFTFQGIADIFMENPTVRVSESDPRLTSLMKRSEIRALLAGTDRSNALVFPQQIRERLAEWTERQAKQVAHAWMLLLAKEKIKDLDLEKTKIEKDIADAESEQSSGGWFGDWAKGERPEGYISTAERLKNLRQQGFKTSEVMKQSDINTLNELYRRASNPVDGLPTLNAEEIALLLRLNKELAGHMDNFEERQAA